MKEKRIAKLLNCSIVNNETMKQCSNGKSRKGFTLIELIIVIGLVTFMSTVGVVAYRDYNQRQSLSAATQDLAGIIRLAKSRAISQVKPSVDCAGLSLDGYGINIPDLSASQYTIKAICEGNNADKKTFKLPRGIEFVDDGSSETTTILHGETQGTGIFFPIITLEVQGTGDIVLKSQSNKKSKVSVDSVGTIRVE